MENKSFLERKIEEIAINEVKSEWNKFVNFCSDNEFGKLLKIGDGRLFSGMSSGCCPSDVLDCRAETMLQSDSRATSNAKEVINKVIGKRVETKTKELLQKIDSLQYLFNNQV